MEIDTSKRVRNTFSKILEGKKLPIKSLDEINEEDFILLLNHGHGPGDDRCPFIEMYVLSKENGGEGVLVTKGQFFQGAYLASVKGIEKSYQEELPKPYLLTLKDFEIYKMFSFLDYN